MPRDPDAVPSAAPPLPAVRGGYNLRDERRADVDFCPLTASQLYESDIFTR